MNHYRRIILICVVLVMLPITISAQSSDIPLEQQIVATVNGEPIYVGEFKQAVRMQRIIDIQQIRNVAQSYVNLRFADDMRSAVELVYQFDTSLRAVMDGLSSPAYGYIVLNQMIDDSLVRHEVNQRDIHVSDEAIDAQIRAFFLFQIEETTDDVTATELQALFDEQLDKFYGWMLRDADADRSHVHQYFETLALRDALATDIFGDSNLFVWANTQHILVATEAEANDVYQALLDGEDFATLARNLSIDTGSGANGGEVGWVNVERDVVHPYSEFAMTLPVGEISRPFESPFGWHIMQVKDREERAASEEDAIRRRGVQFEAWLSEYRESFVIEIFDLWLDVAPTQPNINDLLSG